MPPEIQIAYAVTDTITAPGTWNAPTGIYSVQIDAAYNEKSIIITVQAAAP